MSNDKTFADVSEGVRAALAAYTQALDDGRADDVVATYCVDGVVDIPGMGTHRGHDELRTAYTQWAPRRPQRHLVLNTLVTEWDDRSAKAVSDVVFLLQTKAGWSIQLVGRYYDVLQLQASGGADTANAGEGRWLFKERKAEFVAPPSPPTEDE